MDCQLNDLTKGNTEHVLLVVSIEVLEFELLNLMLTLKTCNDQFKTLVYGQDLSNEKHLEGIIQTFLNSLHVNIFLCVNTCPIFFCLLHFGAKLFSKGIKLYCIFIVLSLAS